MKQSLAQIDTHTRHENIRQRGGGAVSVGRVMGAVGTVFVGGRRLQEKIALYGGRWWWVRLGVLVLRLSSHRA